MISLLPHQRAIEGWCRSRRMLSRASSLHVLQERVIEGRIGRAAELEVQPDAQAQLVAKVEQVVVLVVAAAPEPQRVHVGRHGVVHVAAEMSLVRRLAKQSAGIQLAPLAKNGTPLTTKCSGASAVCGTARRVRRPMRLVAMSTNLSLTKTNLSLTNLSLETRPTWTVERLAAHAGRPPKLRICDG